MPWYVASLVANLGIAVVEGMNRKLGMPTFWHTLPYTGVFILAAQWGLWRAWSGAPHILVAWAFFTACNSAIRLASAHFILHEAVSVRRLVLTTLMFGLAYLMKDA